jgi:hypothetical protein
MKVLLMVGGWIIAMAMGLGAVLDNQAYRAKEARLRASLRDAEQRTTIVKAELAEAKLTVQRDTVRVTRWATRYDTVRQEMATVLATDTVTTVPADWVRSLMVASDSTIAACRDLVSSCERLRIAADSTIHAVERERATYKKLYQLAKNGPRLTRAVGLEREMFLADFRLYGQVDLRLRADLHLVGRLEGVDSKDLRRDGIYTWVGLRISFP